MQNGTVGRPMREGLWEQGWSWLMFDSAHGAWTAGRNSVRSWELCIRLLGRNVCQVISMCRFKFNNTLFFSMGQLSDDWRWVLQEWHFDLGQKRSGALYKKTAFILKPHLGLNPENAQKKSRCSKHCYHTNPHIFPLINHTLLKLTLLLGISFILQWISAQKIQTLLTLGWKHLKRWKIINFAHISLRQTLN